MSKRSRMRKRNLQSSREENSMPTGLIIAELFLAVMCASYVFKLTGSAMDIASSEDLFPSVVNVFMLQLNLVFLVTTIFALLGISSRRTESWKKVVKSCFTFTFSTFLSAYLLHSDSYAHAFDFNPWATLAVLVALVLMMLLSKDIKKFYTPPLEMVRPTSSWFRYIFYGKLYDSKYEVRFEKIEKEEPAPAISSCGCSIMDHKERFLSFFEGNTPDRTPLFLRDFTLGLDNLGCKTTDLIGERYDSALASKSVISFGRMTGQDAIVGCVHTPAFLIEQFDGTMKVPEYGIPMPIVHPLSSPDALDHADMNLKGKALDAIDAYHRTRRNCDDLAIIGNVTGPLTKASVLMGMDVLSLAIHSDMDFVKGVIDTGMEVTHSFMEAIKDDVDVFFFASASDNPSLFGIDTVNTISVPYVKQLSDFSHKMDRPNIYHPHGDYTCKELMDPMVSTGIDCFHFAEANDHCVICKLIDGRCIVMGGTNIVPTLHSGTEKEIVDETKKFLNACSNRRFIFSCSCSLQRGIPLDSIRVMCNTVIDHIGTLRF